MSERHDSPRDRFPVVAIGASAGGLRAMHELFDAVPAVPKAAFVIVAHQPPDHVSLLPELIARHCQLPVSEARDGMHLLRDRVYIAPPGTQLTFDDDVLRVARGPSRQRSRLPIDTVFRSLASSMSERAVAIVLSGSGSDGTLGAKAIKDGGGVVFAQAPDTAEHDSMPASVIAAGIADWVLPPTEMIVPLLDHAERIASLPDERQLVSDEDVKSIVQQLHARTGRDFGEYKASTIRRRTERRMAVQRISSAGEYTRLLEQTPSEIDRLFKDLLIGVTAFFRDPGVWDVVATKVLEPMLRDRPTYAGPLRAWVPGCSTGEEAYTLAIIADEVASRVGTKTGAQVFGTDLDADAIEVARRGVYPGGIAADVLPERLERYFHFEDGRFRVREELRDRVIFAPHDLLSDPPFTRLDLVSCRNVLIYMEASLQERLLPSFHYALNEGGALVLGTSETIGRLSNIFVPIDAHAHVYRRIGRSDLARATRTVRAGGTGGLPTPQRPTQSQDKMRLVTDRLLFARYVPPSIVLNGRGDIVHIHGRTGRYLEPAPGRPGNNAFAMARPGLQLPLSSAVREALESMQPVRVDGITVQTNGDTTRLAVVAEPLTTPGALQGLVVVSFEATPPGGDSTATGPAHGKASDVSDRIDDLEQEVRRSHEELQHTIEELEGSNEELQSMNEELQSANEELETSKEEMHSLNEELQTVNSELQLKVEALSKINDDMSNLLNSTQIATIFLDRELCIRRFTRPAEKLVHLIEGDIGRPIADLAARIEPNNLTALASSVLATLASVEREVQTNDGREYLLRVLPYRTTENVIDGVVVTFIDTSELSAAKAASVLARSIVEAVRHPLMVLDHGLRIVSANAAFHELFGASPADVQDAPLSAICDGAWDVPELSQKLATLLSSQTPVLDFLIDRVFPHAGRLRLLLHAQQLVGPQPERILLALEPMPASSDMRIG